MALTPEYLDTLPDTLILLWQQVEDDILRDIARRIAKALGMTETAAWQLYRLEQTRALHGDVVELLAKYSGRSDAEIRRMLQAAGTEALAEDDAIYRAMGFSPADINTSPALLNLLNAGYRQTRGTWKNLTATTANTVTGKFEDSLSRAWLQVSSGAFDYKTAIKRAVDDLAQNMDYVQYPSGHRDTLEVACRRAVLTGVNQTASKLQIARMEEMDCEFVEVTAHAGARPSHALWQGKVYHIGGETTRDGVHYEDFENATGYGTGPGLCGWNCRHNFFPFFPGASTRAWSEEKLAALDAKDIEYNGKMYSSYEISQMQRALERRVRSAKKLYLAEDAAGLDTSEAAAKLAGARARLKQFSAAIGDRVDSSRTSVSGFGRSQASKAVWAAKNFTETPEKTILNPLHQNGGNSEVKLICKLDKSIYSRISPDIASDSVIITDKQIAHIKERHPDISDSILSFLSKAIESPDYIIATEKPNTANILKKFELNGKGYQLVLRLKSSSDPNEYQNSVITFMSVNEKRWNQYLRNRKILYSSE